MKRSWPGGLNQLTHRVLNGKRTIRQALVYLEQNYTGNSRPAFRHKMEAFSADTTIELQLYWMLHDAIKLGFGNDVNFERVFR